MPTAPCPDCDAAVVVGSQLNLGDRLLCPGCGVELEVLSLRPFEMEYADFEDSDDEFEYEDLDDEWDDDE